MEILYNILDYLSQLIKYIVEVNWRMKKYLVLLATTKS